MIGALMNFARRDIPVRFRLRTLLVVVAVAALVCPWVVPAAKRAIFPTSWNRWIVRTVTRPDGTRVRVRVRRYPDRDVVHEEVLRGDDPEQPDLLPVTTRRPRMSLGHSRGSTRARPVAPRLVDEP